MVFLDRVDAGKKLSLRLQEFTNRDDVIILALPRGGVPVAFEIARSLKAPLDVFLVRKLGVPGREELAMGAIATGGACVLNSDAIRAFSISSSKIERVTAREREELSRREQAYRAGKKPLEIRNRCVILVDDGLATGSSMRVAVKALRQEDPKQIVVAVPVGAKSTCDEIASEADLVVCLITPSDFGAVGEWYRDFSQTTDQDVCDLLLRSSNEESRTADYSDNQE